MTFEFDPLKSAANKAKHETWIQRLVDRDRASRDALRLVPTLDRFHDERMLSAE